MWGTSLTEGYSIESLQGYRNEFVKKYLPKGAAIPSGALLNLGEAYIALSKTTNRLVIYGIDDFELSSETGAVRVTQRGVGTIIIKYMSDPESFAFLNSGGTVFKNIGVSGVYFNDGGHIFAREGAMRYNPTKKKMEFHNGTSWETIQSD